MLHQLFLSDRTGQIINKDFLKLTYPCRWKYDILRALDFFQYTGIGWDNRMKAAIDVLKSKRNNEGSWNMQAAHPGQVHVNMEKAGKPSRWNGQPARIERFDQLMRFGAGRQFTASKGHQRKARKR